MPDFYPSPDTVRAILLASGSTDEIGDRHGVSGMTVRNYKVGKTAVAREAIEALRAEGLEVVPLVPRPPFKRLTPEQVEEIKAAKATSTSRALGKKYGVKATVIRMIWCGKTYK